MGASNALKTPRADTADRAYGRRERLEELRRIKSEHSRLKRQRGPRDNDDWGDIPYAGQFLFVPETDHPKGYVIGPRLCGRNFRRFLEQQPPYVSRFSSLLGGYYFTFLPYPMKWDPENYWTHLAPEHKKYNIIHGIHASQHFGIDLSIGLPLGFGGLLQKIERCRRENPNPDLEFYGALADVVIGIQNWIRAHVRQARLDAKSELSAQLRANLLELADLNDRLIESPPRTFREACQWTAWYQMAARMYNGSGALGRIDQYFYPYYIKDTAEGRLTDDEAIFHLACLNLCDPQYIHVGGIDAEGNDAANELSFLILEAVRRLRSPANVSVGVHEKMDPGLMRKAVELLFLDRLGVPRFFGAENIAQGYAKNGAPLDVARRRAQVGCHWTCLPGIEYSFSDVIKVNFAKVFEAAFDELMAERGAAPSVDQLWRRFQRHLRRAVEVVAEGIDLHMAFKGQYYPELVLDLLCHGPIEKGLDASCGALEYNTICVDGSALATAADSFAALEARVEKERRLTWNEVFQAVDSDFNGFTRIQRLLNSVPSFGRGGTPGDSWAERIVDEFTRFVADKPTPAGFRMVPGLFSWASTIPMGKATGATPNGRGEGAPISFGANPDPGAAKGGSLTPTGMSTAIARVQPGFGNAAPMQLDVDPGLVHAQDGVEKFEALIRTHFRLGGTLINANILDKETIRDAYHNPTKYPDLIVRVTGFSAYFASLSDEFRKLVYDRIVELEGAAEDDGAVDDSDA